MKATKISDSFFEEKENSVPVPSGKVSPKKNNPPAPKSFKEVQNLSKEVMTVLNKFEAMKKQATVYTKQLIATSSGEAERRRTLVRLMEKSRQINRQFYSLKNFRNPDGNVVKLGGF